MSESFGFIRSGYTDWAVTNFYNLSKGGYYWSSISNRTLYSGRLFFTSTYLAPQGLSTKGYGFTVRYLDSQTYSQATQRTGNP